MEPDPRQWIAAVCREARESAGANRTVIAAQINGGEDVIRRFETLRGKWSPQTGAIVAAYAAVAGREPVDLWRAAIERWASAAMDSAQADRLLPDTTDIASSSRNLGKSARAVQERHAKRPRSRKAQ